MLNSVLKSLLIPTTLSALSFAATFWWFERIEKQAAKGAASGEPIAYLRSGNDKIERRSKARVMWQPVVEGTPFYPGDSVRSLPRAEGAVQLLKGSMIITLEPDSLIVLEDNRGSVELNLVSGSLLVESKKENSKSEDKSSAPIIKAGNTKLELGGKDAQLSLSKSANADASIAVAKGEVEVKSGDKTVKVEEGKISTLSSTGEVKSEASVETLAPLPNEVLVINRLKDKKATFSWKPQSSGQKIHLETGPSRTELISTGVVVAAETGSLTWPIPVGPFYWRLVLKDLAGKQLSASMILRAEGLFVSPPVLLSPVDKEVVTIKPSSSQVVLGWQMPPKSKSTRLQISSDREFKSLVQSKNFAEEQEYTFDIPSEGIYFWRILGQWEGFNAAVSSEIRSFEARKLENLSPPKLTSPALNAAFGEKTLITTGFFAEWERVPGATGYRLQVLSDDEEPINDERLSVSQFRISGLKPGKYKWRVMSTSEDGNNSKWSAARSFLVNKLAEIKWLNESEDEFLYETARPKVELKWQAGPQQVKSWQVRHAKNPSDLSTAAWIAAPKPLATLSLEEPGVWYFEAQALDTKGESIAGTKTIRVSIKPKPELDPPELSSSKKILNASSDGTLSLKWQSVAGATGYGLQIKDLENGKVREISSNDTAYVLRDLMPGKYEIRLRTVNAFAKPGQLGEAKTIVVPQISDAPPPKVGGFKVH